MSYVFNVLIFAGLSKLITSNVNPQLVITKFPIQPDSLQEQPISDNIEDDYDQRCPHRDYQQDNSDDNPKEEKITGQVMPTRKLYDRSDRRCEYCSKMISYTNMSNHKRAVHGINPIPYRPTVPFAYSKLREQVSCEFCGKRISYRNLSSHKKYYCAVKLNKSSERKVVSFKSSEMIKFMDKPDNIKRLLKTCEQCKQVVLKARFGEHEKLWCPITKRKLTNCNG